MSSPSTRDISVPWWKRETLMSRVDHLAQTEPERVYAAYPRSPLTYDDGFMEVTYKQLANAVNGIAWHLQEAMGEDVKGQTLAYIGPNDVRYSVLILGAAKAGHKMLLISPRNSVPAQVHLFGATQCNVILSPTPQPPQTSVLLKEHRMKCIDVPDVATLLEQPYRHFPYSKSFQDARLDHFFTVHTSGSTGMPKPLLLNHQFVSTNIEHMQMDPPPGYESQDRMVQKNRVFITFPPFHGAFLACHLFNAIPHGTVMIAPTSGAIATGQGLVDALKHTKIDVAFLVPSIALDLAQDPNLLDIVSKQVDRILYCGGDLPQALGDKIAAKIPLYNQYGASEMGLTPQIWGNRTMDDWKFIEPHPVVSAEMKPVTDTLYEYTIVRKSAYLEQPAAFSMFPELDMYGTRDLYSQHPSNPKLWQWQARMDDVIVFLNGEKANPISMEQYITIQNPDVAKALVIGAQRLQAALLIQLVDDSKRLSTKERASVIERIWPSIQEANKICPAYARVSQSHILFTVPERPMMVAGKGTVQRAGTLAMYETEIENLYLDAEKTAYAGSDTPVLDVTIADEATVQQYIREAILAHVDFKEVVETDDFFGLGMDSLQALLILRRLKQGLELPSLSLSTIYTNPTLVSLVKAVLDLNHNMAVSEAVKAQFEGQMMKSLLQKYQRLLDNLPKDVNSLLQQEIHVVLTGSTGTMGSYLLQTLLGDTAVSEIYCLNRSKDGRETQIVQNQKRGLSSAIDDTRVSFHHVDLSKPQLGLSESAYEMIKNRVTLIIHTAWPVNFNLALDSFEPHLDGIVNLISLAASSPRQVKFCFISSISSVMSYHAPTGLVPEAVVDDLTAPAPIGYAQSKFVGEQIVAHAAKVLPNESVQLSFARIGQIAGAAQRSTRASDADEGSFSSVITWNINEWFPSLVTSSAYIGAFPDTLGSAMGRIDWIPVDILAEILVDLTLHPQELVDPDDHTRPEGSVSERDGVQVLHPQNSRPTTWSVIQPIIADEVAKLTGNTPSIVPLADWLERVRRAMETDLSELGATASKSVPDGKMAILLRKNPAVKLLDWYRDTLRAGSSRIDGNAPSVLDTKLTRAKSARLAGLNSLEEAWIRRWVGEWLRSSRLTVPVG